MSMAKSLLSLCGFKPATLRNCMPCAAVYICAHTALEVVTPKTQPDDPSNGGRAEMNIDGLGQALQSSSHEKFAAIGPELVLPAVQLVNGHAAPGTAGASRATGVETSEDLRARGRSWVLVGAARLALVTPAAGTDPARKAALKQQRLRGFIDRELQPEIEVRTAGAALSAFLLLRAW